MKKTSIGQRFAGQALGSCLALYFAGAHADPMSNDTEAEPFLPAAALVQPALLSGPDFRVLSEVRVRGYMAQYVIDTKYGPLRADSSEVLALRIAELPALDALDRASRSQAFAHALAARSRKT